MKRLITATVPLIALIVIISSCDQGEKSVAIQFKFQQDMKLDYRQVAKGTARVHVDDSLVRDEFREIGTDLTWYIKRMLEDGTAQVVESKTFQYFAKSNLDTTVIDTVEERADVSIYLRPNGELVDVELGPDHKAASAAYWKAYLEQGLPVFPKGEHSQGYSWTQTTKVILPDGPMEASTTFEFKSFAREHGFDCVVVAYDGNLIIPIEPYSGKGYELLSGVDNIRSSGHLYFAYKEGFIVLQKERWLQDGRRLLINEKKDTVERRVEVEYDVDYSLLSYDIP